MAFFSPEFNGLHDLFVHELSDMYDAEKRIVEALPKMEEAANAPELKRAFNDHLHQSEIHVSRLEKCFQQLGKEPEWETCKGMKVLISESADCASAKGDPTTRDAALICAAQKMEHYEIAGYGTLRTFADLLGMHDLADMLQQTLDEEGQTDKRLTQIAQTGVNQTAAH